MRTASVSEDVTDPAVLTEIERHCERFEAAWKLNLTPSIADVLRSHHLPRDAKAQRVLLIELVLIDVEYRWRRAAELRNDPSQTQTPQREPLYLADYAAQFADFGPLDRLSVEVFAEEYRIRQLWGDRPTHNEYLERYGQRGAELSNALARVDRELALQRQVAPTSVPEAKPHEAIATAAAQASPATSPTSKPKVSSNYGGFRLLQKVAEGGMGCVSLAEDCTLKRRVVIKEIRDQLAQHPTARSRFLSEARITGQLEHPGVVPVYALGVDSKGRPFYAMRRVQGRTLEEAIAEYHQDRSSPKLRALLRRFVAVCQTVAYAHTRGVIHRDLKPANIMLGNFGETLVLDWGLARPVADGASVDSTLGDMAHAKAEQRPQMTSPGDVIGTPAYMSPEQAQGQQSPLGPCSDVYSLGAVLCQILSGHPPHTGRSSKEILEKARTAEPALLADSATFVPRPLAAICQHAMARQPSDRYSDALMFAADVQRWLDDEPVTACREPFLQRIWRWSRHHKAATVGTVSALICVVIAVSIGTVLLDASGPAPQPPRPWLTSITSNSSRRAKKRKFLINKPRKHATPLRCQCGLQRISWRKLVSHALRSWTSKSS